jgi:site-specific recombinase XerC
MKDLTCFTIVSQSLQTPTSRALFSASVTPDIKDWYIRKDGTSEIFLQVIIDRQVVRQFLKLYWPPDRFDKTGLCKKRFPNDPLASDYNLIIRQEVSRINDILTFYRLAGKRLTRELFVKEYNTYYNRQDFVAFYEAKLEDRYRTGIITKITHKNQKYTLNLLRAFRPMILFNEMTANLPEEFDAWLRKKHKLTDANSRFGRHKDVRTYINLAIKEGSAGFNPYKGYKIPKTKGKWSALTMEELTKLRDYHSSLEPTEPHARILRRFLFSCYTGLRISDLMQVDLDWLIGDTLVFMPHKTAKHGKQLKLPLNKYALEIFHQEAATVQGSALFRHPEEQVSNRILKTIQNKLEIPTRLHHHVGRETFATLFLELGGQIEMLKEYMGHSEISTTMKYVHITEARKRREMERMNELFNKANLASPTLNRQ